MGRYDDLPSFATRINGRDVSIPEIPIQPTIDAIQGPYMLIETEHDGMPWDALAVSLGMPESSYWVLAALNRLAAPDPIRIPAGITIVVPSPHRTAAFEEGAGGLSL